MVPEYDPYQHLDTNAFGAVNPILLYLNMTPIENVLFISRSRKSVAYRWKIQCILRYHNMAFDAPKALEQKTTGVRKKEKFCVSHDLTTGKSLLRCINVSI